MKIDRSRVFLTAHWVDQIFHPVEDRRNEIFGFSPETPVLLFAGRLSQEKGVMELPEIYHRAKEKIPGLMMVISGTGPAEASLREVLPEARFLGWIDHDQLPYIYSSSDILVLPSRFDTFSCVVLEAISCGLPVIAYNSKGPRDILQDQVSGYLVEDAIEMTQCIVQYFSDQEHRNAMKHAAIERAASYGTDIILNQFILDVGLQKAC